MAKIRNIASLRGGAIRCDCEAIENRLSELETRMTEVEKGQCDCEEIDNRLTTLEQNTSKIQLDITEMNRQLSIINIAIEISDVRTAMSTTTQLSGLGAAVISIGPTYNYWGIGVKTGTSSLSQGAYYLVTPTEFPELAWYQGATTISTVWIQSGGVSTAYPLYINQTGIWFYPTNTITIANNATFNFTQTLILVDPT